MRIATSLVSALLLLFATCSFAQGYPSKSVQMIVPWPPGGGQDLIGRAMARSMSETLGQPVVVINRAGAAGTIGTAALASANPDGYTIGFIPITTITNASYLMKSVSYRVDSFAYICQIFESTIGVAVPQSSPFKTLRDIVEYGATSPGKLTYGHFGRGSLTYLSMQHIVAVRGLRVVDVQYKGDAAMFPDLQSGRLSFGAGTLSSMIGQPLRVVGIFSDTRDPSFPEVPTVKELNLPSNPAAPSGVLAPKGLPAEVTQRLESACGTAVGSDTVRITMQRLHQIPKHLGTDAFTRRAAEDYLERGAVIKVLNLAAE